MIGFVPGALAATRAIAQVLEASPLAGVALLMAILGLLCLGAALYAEKRRVKRSARAALRWAHVFFACCLASAGLCGAAALVPDDSPAPAPVAQEAPPCIHAPTPAEPRAGAGGVPPNGSMTRPA